MKYRYKCNQCKKCTWVKIMRKVPSAVKCKFCGGISILQSSDKEIFHTIVKNRNRRKRRTIILRPGTIYMILSCLKQERVKVRIAKNVEVASIIRNMYNKRLKISEIAHKMCWRNMNAIFIRTLVSLINIPECYLEDLTIEAVRRSGVVRAVAEQRCMSLEDICSKYKWVLI